MDGKTALYRLRNLLLEDANSAFLDDRTSYDFINAAASEFVQRTKSLKSSQAITTVADQRGYTLNANFMELYLKDKQNKLYLPYNDGSSSYSEFIYWKDYEDLILEDNITSVSIPSGFTIIDDATLDSQVTGTATSAGASSGGQSILTDTAADFSDVSAGDIVHNTTDGSDGVVLSKTSSTVLVVALFGGTANDWTDSDAYVIQPQGRLQLQIDPPSSTAGHTLTVHYVQRPSPVYSDYGTFRFQPQHMDAILKYAAFNYKYRDQDPNYGDAYYQHWDRQLREANHSLNKSFNRKRLKVNMRARR
jgi:hypothetical protein